LFELKNKVVVVTGGNRGIGRAIVEMLEELGAKVVYINKSKIGSLKSWQIRADVTSFDEMEKAYKLIEQRLGSIYGVVCNAGITNDSLFHKSDLLDWKSVLDVNLTGVYNTIRPIINKLYERNEGSIVLISSIVGESGNVGQVNYSASKAGLIGFGKSLAKEGAKYNVRTNIVAPGFTETTMTNDLPINIKEKITNSIPLKRFAHPREIAWSVNFLLSPVMSSYITGEVIRVNGGQLM